MTEETCMEFYGISAQEAEVIIGQLLKKLHMGNPGLGRFQVAHLSEASSPMIRLWCHERSRSVFERLVPVIRELDWIKDAETKLQLKVDVDVFCFNPPRTKSEEECERALHQSVDTNFFLAPLQSAA